MSGLPVSAMRWRSRPAISASDGGAPKVGARLGGGSSGGDGRRGGTPLGAGGIGTVGRVGGDGGGIETGSRGSAEVVEAGGAVSARGGAGAIFTYFGIIAFDSDDTER